MANANARLTIGAVLGTVGTAATTIGGALETVSAGVQILDVLVQDQLVRQRARSAVDMEDFLVSLAQEKALEMSQREQDLITFYKAGDGNKELFLANLSKVEAVIETFKAKEKAMKSGNPLGK